MWAAEGTVIVEAFLKERPCGKEVVKEVMVEEVMEVAEKARMAARELGEMGLVMETEVVTKEARVAVETAEVMAVKRVLVG